MPDIDSVICPIPFHHLNISPNGSVHMCCMEHSDTQNWEDLTVGYIEKPEDAYELINHPHIVETRKMMLAGERPPICHKCYELEDNNSSSLRIGAKCSLKNITATSLAAITEPDGTIKRENFKYRYMDLRASNLCNLRCRSCGPQFSSSIQREYEKLGWLQPVDDSGKAVLNKHSSVIQQLAEYFSEDIEWLYFAGGEPMIIPEFWQILDGMIQRGHTNKNLSYNLNMSKLPNDRREMWKQFNHVHISPSIDDMGDRAELLRKGTDWPKMKENMFTLAQWMREGVVSEVFPSITVSVYNLPYITELVDWLLENKLMSGDNTYQLNIVHTPAYQHIRNLPDSVKWECFQKIRAFQQKWSHINTSKFDVVLHGMKQQAIPEHVEQLKSHILHMDSLREENTYAVYPHLLKLF